MSERSEGEVTGPQPPAGAQAGPAVRTKIRKEYYSIGDVCRLVDLKPHVLRYWESQFPALTPSKNRSGNRVYRRKEIKLILLVKHLLYKEKYTIDGAKQKLDRLRRDGELPDMTRHALDADLLESLRGDLRSVLQDLTLDDDT